MRAAHRADCVSLDAADPLAPMRDRFSIPTGRLYFDGNSLGPPTHAVRERVLRTLDEEWGQDLVASWNRHGWIHLPRSVGARIAPLLGAEASEVVVCDSTSVDLYKVLAAAIGIRPDRKTIAVDDTIFPTDLYIAQGLADLVGSRGGASSVAGPLEIERVSARRLADPDTATREVLDRAAVVLVQHVDFRSGRRHDMAAASATVARHGALSLWDLSHSVGAMPIDLSAAGVDFAVGCGYKFLAGGPGAPAFLYAAERHHDSAQTPLPGWLGHARPFEFDDRYEPAPGAGRFVCGTPPILSLAALDAALDVWDSADLEAVRTKSLALGDLFHERVEARLAPYGVEILSPSERDERGSQVSLRHPEAWPIVRALHERDVVGDFRVPDVLRFGLAPLYLRYVDIWDAVEAMAEILDTGVHRDPRFAERSWVT